MPVNGIPINVKHLGRGKFCVTASFDGRAFVNTGALWEEESRHKLADAIGETLGLTPEQKDSVGVELTRLALETARQVDEPEQKPKDDRRFTIEDIKPWPEPVELGNVLKEASAALKKHMFMPDEAIIACCLWAAHTHCFDRFDVSPILCIESPVKRCGKTTLLTILKYFVARPLPTSNITASALFRVIEDARPTLLIDEADSFLCSEELRGIINSGHTRDTAFVVRTNLDSLEPQRFSTWSPKGIAAIGGLPGTIEDRALIIKLDRKPPGVVKTRLARTAKTKLVEIGRKLARWAADYSDALDSDWEPTVPEALNDRAADSWQPLLVLAEVAGGPWPELARRAAVALSSDDADRAETAIRLLGDIAEALMGWNDTDLVETRTLLERLHDVDEWQHYGRSDKPLNGHQLARLLRPFGIRTSRTKAWRGYKVADLREAITKYVPPSPQKVSPSVTNDASHVLFETYDDSQSVTQMGGDTLDSRKVSPLSCDYNSSYDTVTLGDTLQTGNSWFSKKDDKPQASPPRNGKTSGHEEQSPSAPTVAPTVGPGDIVTVNKLFEEASQEGNDGGSSNGRCEFLF